ncbi:MAG: MFS transporter [Bacteroidetes bacterium]|nr:MFS transporter [Bacteroidota bacterium]
MNTANTAKGISKVIVASSLGTLIEWYDFYIFGMLAKTISIQFFPEGNDTAALLSTLAIFAAGFLVRPFGALVFGRLGDSVGRKHTFLLTLVLMGGATFCIGLVPSYTSIGMAAPLLVLLLRLIQGLALGGEYGGAATYVAEHAPQGKRGFYTAWIQTTATLGLFTALGAIVLVKMICSTDAAFNAPWGGWRYPFWLSLVLVLVSVYIRLRMKESPVYAKLKAEKKLTTNPIKESFGRKQNFKMVLLALFGAVMGQGVIWYTGQFYAQSFLENTVKIAFLQNREIMLWAIALATPFFLVFGAWSDRVGRKWIMLAGMILGIFCYRPLFNFMLNNANTDEWKERVEGMRYVPLPGQKNPALKTDTIIKQKDTVLLKQYTEVWQLNEGLRFTETYTDTAGIDADGGTWLIKSKHHVYADKILTPSLKWKYISCIWLMIVFVTMVYGPIAAFLVELFPSRIRYTSMSLPYHIGNGVFGGLVPFIATLLATTFTDDPLAGLWYPIGVAALCSIISLLYINNQAVAYTGKLLRRLKRIMGIFWLLLAPAIIYFLIATAVQHTHTGGNKEINQTLPWVIIITIFTPVAAGLLLFGVYALKGEYDVLSEEEEK